MSVPAAEPRRLLFVITSSDFGGTESFLLQLLSHLDRRRFAPSVCSLRPTGRAGERIAELGVPVFSLGMAAGNHPWQLLAGVRRLVREIDERGIELVQSLLYRANLMAAIAGRLSRRRPPVVSGQRSLVPARARWAVRWVRATRRLAARVVAVSEAVKREVVVLEGIDPERVVVIHNGVDAGCFHPEGDAAVRAEWGLPEGAQVVGAVGRLDATKGLSHLLEAVARVRATGRPLHLVIAGSGPEKTALEAQVAELDLAPAVRFLGFRRGLESLYPAFDLYALPSLAEGSPNALLEAMACGRPAVASRVGGVPEIVEDGRSGLLVPPGDTAALAAALERLAADAELRERLGAEARRRVEADLTLERMVASYEALYDELLVPRLY